MSYSGTNSVRPGQKEKAEGAISFGMNEQPPTKGPELVYPQRFSVEPETGFGPEPRDNAADAAVSNPNPPHGYDLDPNLEPNKFPRQSGSDTYTGIPGDGIVPG